MLQRKKVFVIKLLSYLFKKVDLSYLPFQKLGDIYQKQQFFLLRTLLPTLVLLLLHLF